MRTPSITRVLSAVIGYYHASRDFNGIRLSDVREHLDLTDVVMRRAVRALIRRGALSAIYGDIHPNAYIRALPDEPIEAQLAKLTAESDPCLYPTETTLAGVVKPDLQADRPYTRRLALGEPQLAYAAFDLAVLESYRNDPRYIFEAGDAGGTMSVTDEHYESDGMPTRDKIYLQSFGFCFGPKKRRAVAVFLRYLSSLTPEHQKLWHARELAGKYKMHPDYWASAMGHFPTGASMFDAMLAEMTFINRMAEAMGRPRLFKRDFSDGRPKEFAFLLRPTQKDFDAFAQTLDKMLSENLDRAFFQGEVAAEISETRKNDQVVVKPKGTITMLEEWIGRRFRSADPAVPELFATFKEVRALRSKPSHTLRENTYDETLFDTQRELMRRVYRAVQTLRLILAYWPETKGVEAPRILRGKTTIWTM